MEKDHGKQKQIILVFPEEKKYLKLPMADSWANLINNLTPKAIIEHAQSGDNRVLGPATVDGHDVEGFETNNPGIWPIPEQYWFLFPIKNIKWQFWIDIERDLPLPVAADLEVTTGRGLFTLFKELRVACHAYDMQYDQDIPPSVFDPNIPADYTPLNLESAVTENAAWIGVGGVPVGLLVFQGWRKRKSRTAEKMLAKLR